MRIAAERQADRARGGLTSERDGAGTSLACDPRLPSLHWRPVAELLVASRDVGVRRLRTGRGSPALRARWTLITPCLRAGRVAQAPSLTTRLRSTNNLEWLRSAVSVPLSVPSRSGSSLGVTGRWRRSHRTTVANQRPRLERWGPIQQESALARAGRREGWPPDLPAAVRCLPWAGCSWQHGRQSCPQPFCGERA